MSDKPNPLTRDSAALDRLAAEALGWVMRPTAAGVPSWYWASDGSIGRMRACDWHPTTSHDQCQLLVDEIVRRGLVWQYRKALLATWPNREISWEDYLATATPLAKTQAAVATLAQAKGE